MNPSAGGWLSLLSLLVAMVLAVVHLPEAWPPWLGWLRPAWVAMVIFYWVMALPHRLGLVSAWLVGFLVDVLQADPLGLNGVLLAGITYIAWRFYERLRMYSIVQQCGIVCLLVIFGESARVLVQDLLYSRGWSWGVLLTGGVSMLVWPFLFLLLERLRIQARVE